MKVRRKGEVHSISVGTFPAVNFTGSDIVELPTQINSSRTVQETKDGKLVDKQVPEVIQIDLARYIAALVEDGHVEVFCEECEQGFASLPEIESHNAQLHSN